MRERESSEPEQLTFGADPWAENILRWYFTEGESVGSPPSNFSAMASAMCPASGSHPDSSSWHVIKVSSKLTRQASEATEIDERLLAAVERSRPVRRALGHLSPEAQQILRDVFGPHGGKLPGLGPCAPAAWYTSRARVAFLASGEHRGFEAWLCRLCTKASTSGRGRSAKRGAVEAATAVAEIRAEAEKLIRMAVGAFSTSTRRGRMR